MSFNFVTISAEEATTLSSLTRKPSEDYYDLVNALEVGSGARVDLTEEGMPTKVTFRRNALAAARDVGKGLIFKRTRDNSVIFTVVTLEEMEAHEAERMAANAANANGNGTGKPRGRPKKEVETELEPAF